MPEDFTRPWEAAPVSPSGSGQSIYHRLGGDLFFRSLVERFYARVECDPVLRPLFPASLAQGKERQLLFLAQFFGGPARYSELHGHPRLRANHLPFPIGQRERDRWLGHMLAALEELKPPEPEGAQLRSYFSSTSQFLINLAGEIEAEFGAGGQPGSSRP
jgi:hemoglobin